MSASKLGTIEFLGEKPEFPFSGNDLDRMLLSGGLSDEDSNIFQTIRDYVTSKGTTPFGWTRQEPDFISHLCPEKDAGKIVRYLIHRHKFVIYPQERKLSRLPVVLLIEPTSFCNLRCTMCYQVDKTFTTNSYMGMMDMGLFQNVVDEAASGGVGAITLASRGEPTLHPRLAEMLEYLSGKFIEVKLTTNATRLSDSLIRTVLETEVNIVVFSVDASDKETYEKIRVRGKFQDVLANIEAFRDIRRSDYPDSLCATRISAVKVSDVQDPIEFKGFWKGFVDEVSMKSAALRWDTYNNPPSLTECSPCGYLWERMYVWHDGTVGSCDADYKSKLNLGRYGPRTLAQLWYGEELTNLRSLHMEKLRATKLPCDRCGINY